MGTQKPTLKRITQIANNEEAAVALFNDNFKIIEESIKDSVSRSGLDPTQMTHALDMSEHRIINVAPAKEDTDVVTLGQVNESLKAAQNAMKSAQDAENAASRANTSSFLAEESKKGAQTAAAGAKAHEDNAQMIYDELITNEAVKTVYENIEDVKEVAENIDNLTGDFVWGGLKGDINDQEDLQQALDKKVTNNATSPNLAVGNNASAYSGSIAFGIGAMATGPTLTSYTRGMDIAIGYNAQARTSGTDHLQSDNVAIGSLAMTDGTKGAVAIGFSATAEADNAVQLGEGTNSTEGSLQFRDYQLLDASGKIPAERLPEISGGSNDSFKALTEAQKATLLKDGTYNGSDVEDGEIFTEDSGKFVEFDKVLREAGYSETFASDMNVSSLNGGVAVAEGNGAIVIGNNSKGAVSYDGINWETYSVSGLAENINSFIFDGTRFVCYGSSKVFKSTDGKNWTTETVSSGPAYHTIVYFSYDDGRYAIILKDKTVWSSEDAVTWAQIGTLPSGLDSSPRITRRSDGLYLALDSSAKVSTSTNLTEWTEPVASNISISSATGSPYGLESIGNIFTTILYSSSGRIYWSEDGVSWTAGKIGGSSSLYAVSSLRKRGNKLFINGEKVRTLHVSEDGKNFTKLSEEFPSKYLTAIACGSGKTCVFYASAYSGPTDVQLTVIADEPYYEYFLQSLSYTKEEVDNNFSDVSDKVDLAKVAYAGEGVCLLTEPVTDYEAVGSGPTISEDYTATGFSGSNYLSKALDNVEVAKGVVLEAAFSVSSLTASQILQLRDSSSAIIGRIAFTSSGTVTGVLGSASLTSTTTFTTGQKVYARIAYDTTTLSLYTSTDGKEWTLEKSQSLSPSATPITGKIATLLAVGVNSAAATIYLPECSLSYQGKEIWRAVEGIGKTGIAVDDHLKLLVAEEGPSEATVGHIGQIYVNKAGNVAYMCVGTDSGNYIWKQITA